MDYLKLLNFSYKIESFGEESLTKYEYLSSDIFNFITYDEEMDELFTKKALEVCVAINNREIFPFIKDEENYKWFIIMCNMPFFLDKIEWGTSIRGAWWINKEFEINSCGLFDENEDQILNIKFNLDQWKEFINALNCFIND